jgi:hypothetical protein
VFAVLLGDTSSDRSTDRQVGPIVWRWQRPERPPPNHLQSSFPVKPVLTARDLISLVAFLITAAEFTYWLGRRTRQVIDSASDTLAALWAISWGVGEQPHYEVLSEAIDTVIAAFAPAKPAEMLSLSGTCVIGSVTPATLPLPPAPSAPSAPSTPRPAPRRRSSAKTQD